MHSAQRQDKLKGLFLKPLATCCHRINLTLVQRRQTGPCVTLHPTWAHKLQMLKSTDAPGKDDSRSVLYWGMTEWVNMNQREKHEEAKRQQNFNVSLFSTWKREEMHRSPENSFLHLDLFWKQYYLKTEQQAAAWHLLKDRNNYQFHGLFHPCLSFTLFFEAYRNLWENSFCHDNKILKLLVLQHK